MKRLLQYSIDKELRHIPSALSQYSYLKHILPHLDYTNIDLVIGKPFGSQAYYTIWEEIGLLEDKEYNYGIKHEELPFVNFSEETLGNALGVAAGINLANNRKTIVNLSDGAIQMGPTLEAIQFIGANQLDITCFVDCNGYQLTGSTKSIANQDCRSIQKIFDAYGWRTIMIDSDDFNFETYRLLSEALIKPAVFLFRTRKGHGVPEMEDDPVTWHYKPLRSLDEITIK